MDTESGRDKEKAAQKGGIVIFSPRRDIDTVSFVVRFLKIFVNV
jgi:hypothetical protein